MVLAPEHPLVNTITTPEQRTAVDTYLETTARKSDLSGPISQKRRAASGPALSQ
jgi:leucyl-tRNA synthetase